MTDIKTVRWDPGHTHTHTLNTTRTTYDLQHKGGALVFPLIHQGSVGVDKFYQAVWFGKTKYVGQTRHFSDGFLQQLYFGGPGGNVNLLLE